MRIGSLFAGVGGLDLAVQAVFGGEHAWFSEIDPAASKVLAYRFPGVPNLGDITTIDWKSVEPVDVLCGGFPCQDVSAAGKRAGIKDGTRSGLWAVFAQAIDALRPQYVVIENVRGLLSAAAHRTVEDDAGDYLEPDSAGVGDGAGRPVLRAAGAVLGDLADLGYDAQWATVAAADVGAPHRRERVFIVATDSTLSAGAGLQQQDLSALQQRRGNRRPGQPGVRDCGDTPCGCNAPHSSRNGWDEGRPESAGIIGGFDAAVSGDEPGRVELLPTPGTMDGIERRTTHAGGNLTLQGAVVGVNPVDVERHARAGRTVSGDEPGVALLPTPVSRDGKDTHSSQQMADKSKLTGIAHLLPTPEAKNSHAGPDYARMNRDGSGGHDLVTAVAYHDISATAWGKYEPAIRRWEQVTGQPAPPPTEPNKNGNPRLSAAFSEWLMGWPAGWVTDPAIGISRNDQLRCVGNGVVSLQAVAAIRYLLAVAAGLPTATKPAAEAPALLPTPCVVDRLATGEMTLEEWDESRRSQKERGVGSFGPRGDSLGAAVLRVEEGTERPDYSTTKKRR